MGAVCYQVKRNTINKEDVLRAINDKHAREAITEPDSAKTLKTDEQQQQQLLTFSNFTQSNINETYQDTHNTQSQLRQLSKSKQKRSTNLNPNIDTFGDIELKILTYYGSKEEVYQTLIEMNRKTLYYLRKNYINIENQRLYHKNEKIKFVAIKSIEEHNSGVNQMLSISQKELVTVSDDCTLKFWSSQTFKIESQIMTETITCIAATGQAKKDLLVAGCHSGNLIMINTITKTKRETINMAHYNLIRVIVTLEALKNKYFVSADVCGIVKVWSSQQKPQQLIEIHQEGAISYNSMIEVVDMLPKRQQYEDNAMIACALKSQKINLILLIPSSGQYQIIKTLKTIMKPTCLIQLSQKHLAIAVGSLKENSNIEIHDMNKSKIISNLCHHTDMIDSLLKLELSSEKTKTTNLYITWLLSASRDRSIILWKLMDGKILKRNKILSKSLSSQSQLLLSKQSQVSENGEFNMLSVEQSQELELKQQQKLKKSLQNSMNDFFYQIETNHKDFIRSMVQVNDHTLLTASEDKTIKIFNIIF